MTTDLQAQPRGIAVTGKAATRILSVMAKEPPGSMLRVSVVGGGCSGFQYIFDVDQEKAPGDLVIERDGATVLIDETSLDLLEGCTIDFVDDLIGQSFKITNPNATSSCGCGTSFAL
ncbi:iron-sulfur cluster assembly accessory protein [Bosea sp. (in: a-proteobacteria)]|jgi:iron-sulfur cluster assembly accessory protein|uniref:HesB/IscA family protein n=1 Tax=Bosea sp. (in: a-proteobacteria) TaxID=1871050 RepID=UPI00273773B6|nr:iron-sulfur cluster assembly accessory protein [Bosea sp. (in: a-proteobacteria)]MDP3407981.1 iron-sulfur cluster assembly accessory protein [Bosea sp. (in: a-proteobacteria)]